MSATSDGTSTPARGAGPRRRVALAVLVSVVTFALLAPATAASGPFADVSRDHPFLKPIMFMNATEISAGYDDGTYRPGQTVTRQAMAAFIHRANRFTIETDEIVVASGRAGEGEVACSHPYHQVLAGGASTDTPNVYLVDSRPGPDADTWQVRVRSEGSVTRSWTTTVYAICGPAQVRPAPPT